MSYETVPTKHLSPFRPLSYASVPVPSTKSPQESASSLVHSSSASPVPTIDPRATLSSHIAVSFSGETFTYDLRSLQSDPREIIQLLKSSASERGNWMIIAAHYRRIGNPSAAITVMTELLDVMAQHSVPEQDLKPVFLLLSGCEKDLGTKHKNADVKISADHYRNAQKWLQKVYNPGPGSVSSAPVAVSVTPHTPPASRSESTRPTPLERQVQSLRDRLNNHVNLLAESQSLKRELEDDFVQERGKRRKLERQVEDLRKEREKARSMELYALDQMRREVDNRRRAEEHARELQIDLEKFTRSMSGHYQRSPSPYY
ncbi:hypothetical protein K435DRAFT_963110 [Dendrothele bispora CBS 962.96]|uniref:Uncharacterized protein n=1 Tax=Dendrothele bispora (strain CBS 962.96) TaxID=1314807 RepID=A0A4S8MI46_DENBC|nr:hypothetical protein K435DRAFT_963110 [Dendrothele bispora CBS 962.96]